MGTLRSQTIGWQRVEAFGAELAVVADQAGLRANGWALGAAPVHYSCQYTLVTDARWRTTSVEVRTEGAGWSRTLQLRHDPDRPTGWRVRASESGDLAGPPPGAEYPETFADALDVDLSYSPLTNTLPIRRLGLLDAPAGQRHGITVVWVALPSLAVIASEQEYTATGPGRVRFRAGEFQAELDVDGSGFVTDYPGLALRS